MHQDLKEVHPLKKPVDSLQLPFQLQPSAFALLKVDEVYVQAFPEDQAFEQPSGHVFQFHSPPNLLLLEQIQGSFRQSYGNTTHNSETP